MASPARQATAMTAQGDVEQCLLALCALSEAVLATRSA
ncbi:hypothetical protein XOCgx_0769 [Xanthomonas oryzae pv. oryzicola]|nr:hypothetical protein XOCgx_0769 [Xanthomonas oryzae pv. oryzicola]